ncbi:C40 family peptidase [Rudanella lutea]|uniref:C40 family peptidase n=1 Tax=Rudanella lutea TaxID=451374 RepID=UPI0003797B68|nr:C40 family peptidase [Rudanella lutea]
MIKKMLLTVLFTVSFSTIQAQSVPAETSSTETSFYDQIPLVGEVINYAKKHLSIRYRSGGTTPRGFDCSGFTRFCFSKFGIQLPHSSAAQGNVGQPVDKEEAKPGDLIFFKGHSASGSRIGHVGMITEVVGDKIKFIHSAWNGGIRYDYLHADYYQRRFVGVRRVVTLLAEK